MVLQIKPKNLVQSPRGSDIWRICPNLTWNEPVGQLSETLPEDPKVVVRFLLLLHSFYFTHAQYGHRACALAFIIETHMDYDIQVDNLGCDSRLFHSASHTALTPPLRDWVLASWRPMGLGVFSQRGNRLYSDGELVNVLPEKGRRTAGTSDGTCGHPERETLAWPFVVF